MAAGGAQHSLALNANGTLWSWGYNHKGQLGDGSANSVRTEPAQIGTATNWSQVAAGWEHSVALRTDGSLWTWGSNEYGQLGSGPLSARNTPAQVGTAAWAHVAAGMFHTLAVRSDGTLWAWGGNAAGQLGDGTTTQRAAPVQIGSDNGWIRVAAGAGHSLALRNDGTLWAWGNNSWGQLGDGTGVNRASPVQIGTDSNWQQAAAGYDHSAAVRADGSLWTWGYNTYGQIGDGTNAARLAPLQIGIGDYWSTVAAGKEFTIARAGNATLWAWGRNDNGQLGDGSTTHRNVPVQSGTLNEWERVAAGSAHVLALRNEGTLWTWGLNGAGQLGNGDTAAVLQPTPILWRSVGSTASLLPANGPIHFGSVNVGSSSAAVARTLTAGPDPVILGAIASVSPDFSVTHNCPENLPAGASCSISMTFVPKLAGARSTQLILNTEATISGGLLWLAGTGLAVPPGPPALTGSMAGIGQITLTFTPGATGGSAILDYTATCTSAQPGSSRSVTGTASPIVVTGLSHGVAYTCSVSARNIAGPGSPSPVSAALVPLGPPVTLTIQKIGSGASRGTVTSNIAGIQCGADCSEAYPAGTQVTLTATTPIDSGVVPAGWSGVVCQENLPGICTTTVDQAATAQVAFATLITFGQSLSWNIQIGGSRTFSFSLCAGDQPVAAGTLGGRYTIQNGGLSNVQIAHDLNGNELIDAGEEISWSNLPPVGLAAGACAPLLFRVTAMNGRANGDISVVHIGIRHPQMPPGEDVRAVIQLTFTSDGSLLDLKVQGNGSTWPYLPSLRDVHEGSTLYVEARPAPGWRFSHWTGMPCGHGYTTSTCAAQIPVSERGQTLSLTAHFVRDLNAQGGAADFNNDRRTDLLWRNSADGSVQAWLMAGTNVTQVAGLLPPGGYTVTHLADLDGNGKTDTLLRHADGTTIGWLHDGLNVVGQATFFPAGSGWSILHTTDLNGDGKADLIIQHTDGTVVAWLMNGLTVTGAATLVPAGAGWSVSRVGDLNGDGKADLLWQNIDGTVQAWLMDGLAATQVATFAGAGTGWSVKLVGDFDGNGKADLIWQHSSGAVQAWLMDGMAVTQIASLVPAGTGWSPVLAGDLNSDGRSDLFWEHTDGRSQTWMMNGLSPLSQVSYVGAGGWKATHLHDLNGDGLKDVLWRHTDGSVQAWIMSSSAFIQVVGLAGPGNFEVVPPRQP